MTPGWQKIHVLVGFLAIALLLGCSPTRPPINELDAASRALGSARAAEAPTYAAAEYRSAGQRFDQAQAAEGRGDYDDAARYARESMADSELAAAKARLAKTRTVVERLKQDNANLDRDLVEHAAPEGQP